MRKKIDRTSPLHLKPLSLSSSTIDISISLAENLSIGGTPVHFDVLAVTTTGKSMNMVGYDRSSTQPRSPPAPIRQSMTINNDRFQVERATKECANDSYILSSIMQNYNRHKIPGGRVSPEFSP